MINLERYDFEFEQEYWRTVDKKISEDTKSQILESCVKYFPSDFFDAVGPTFGKLILAPFAELKRAKVYINNVSQSIMNTECFDSTGKVNELYIQIYKAYEDVANAQTKRASMRVRIVKNADLTVCPYCNRDYINCRAENIAGAQLDHFFSRANYPVFAVSLYNLVPVCGNCNRIKSDKLVEFASPFDETIDWKNDVKFLYKLKSMDNVDIDIQTLNPAIQNNIKEMHLKEAYQIHESEVLELIEKKQAYSESQKCEFQEILNKMKITDDEIKRIIFGPEMTQKDMRKKPLGKMIHDMHRQMEIYEER